jgi:hypothetical protein
MAMANLSKGTLWLAKQDKAVRLKEELDELTLSLSIAREGDDQGAIIAAGAALEEWYGIREAEADAKNGRKQAKKDIRAAKKEGSIAIGKKVRTWSEGGRGLVKDLIKKTPVFQVAAEGNLAKCNRDIGRWETDAPYANARGVNRGEILMIISEHYEGSSGKNVVDVMVGADIVRGVPALALRPLE